MFGSVDWNESTSSGLVPGSGSFSGCNSSSNGGVSTASGISECVTSAPQSRPASGGSGKGENIVQVPIIDHFRYLGCPGRGGNLGELVHRIHRHGLGNRLAGYGTSLPVVHEHGLPGEFGAAPTSARSTW